MTLPHVISGEVINLKTLKPNLPTYATCALVKTSELEVIRMVLPAGKKIAPHSVAGKISVQCLAGRALFSIGDRRHHLVEGDWLFLNGFEVHALEAETDTTLLVTILLAASH